MSSAVEHIVEDTGWIEPEASYVRDGSVLGFGQGAERIRQLIQPCWLIFTVYLRRRRRYLNCIWHGYAPLQPNGIRQRTTTAR